MNNSGWNSLCLRDRRYDKVWTCLLTITWSWIRPASGYRQ